jgi:uncharacterized protein
MAIIYLDSSALVKRYAVERGTAWVVRLADPTARHDLYTVRLTRVEVIAALQRKVRTGEATTAALQRAEASFEADWRRRGRIIE